MPKEHSAGKPTTRRYTGKSRAIQSDDRLIAVREDGSPSGMSGTPTSFSAYVIAPAHAVSI